MPTYIALLRAVNVGGTGKLPMAELKAMCVAEGFADVQTYIASGNVVFTQQALRRQGQDGAGAAAAGICRQAGRCDHSHRGGGWPPCSRPIHFRKRRPISRSRSSSTIPAGGCAEACQGTAG